MTRLKRSPPLGPSTRKIRQQPPEPIGMATSRAACGRAGLAILSLAQSISRVLVLVDPRARVYAVPSNSERARIYGECHASWIVGVFNKGAAASDIAEAISTTFELLEGSAA